MADFREAWKRTVRANGVCKLTPLRDPLEKRERWESEELLVLEVWPVSRDSLDNLARLELELREPRDPKEWPEEQVSY